MIKKIALGIGFAAVLAISGVGVARELLPQTSCRVSESQIEALILEEISYSEVRGVLGCDGVLLARQNLGDEILLEDYGWRRHLALRPV